jgi:hypothetical protein
MKFHLYRRPYNLGTIWRKSETVEAVNCIAALKTAEFENEKMHINPFDKRIGILGGVSEFIALSGEENENWDGYYIPPAK